MGSVSFGSVGGSGSGIDVLGFVNQVLFAERAPVRLLETQKVLLDAQSSALSDINTKLSDLKDAINALKDLSGKFNTKITASSDTSVLTATADASATAATHSITVSALATTSSYYSSQLADGSTTFATGSFDLQIGTGSPTTITVDATNDTLDDLATHINSLALGVTASVITDADGARLSILSDASGVPGDLTISSNTTGLTFTKAATGTNASLTVNNVPINSTSNTVSGVIAGVTLSLTDTTASAVTVTVQPDTTQAREAIDDFVDSYNEVITAINAQFAYDAENDSAPPLASDSSLRLVQTQILTASVYSITGNNGLVNLGSIGVSTQDDGTLLVDGSKLDGYLSTNFTDVQNLFQSQSPAGFAENFSTEIIALTDSIDGPLHLALKGVADSKSSITDQIEAFEVRLEFRRQSLIDEFSRVDVLLRSLPVILAQVQSQLRSLS
ncbi:MAG: flagellar filament capping protein FliD [Acidobacteria bacterium]|nr:flagellar filament capping protein FliD [Acidobacteriota bacterium]